RDCASSDANRNPTGSCWRSSDRVPEPARLVTCLPASSLAHIGRHARAGLPALAPGVVEQGRWSFHMPLDLRNQPTRPRSADARRNNRERTNSEPCLVPVSLTANASRQAHRCVLRPWVPGLDLQDGLRTLGTISGA